MALTNNDILKKLRVAMKFRDEDIIEVLKLVDYDISKSELGAFFRKEGHPKYMECQDQILRNFLNGLIIYNRGTMEERKPSEKKKESKKTDKKKFDSKKFIKRKSDQKSSDNKKSEKRKPRPRL